MLTGHPEASRLFKRSIAMSYPGSFTPISKERAAELADALVEELGCKDNPARIADIPIAEGHEGVRHFCVLTLLCCIFTNPF
jgi:carboxylesterase type B